LQFILAKLVKRMTRLRCFGITLMWLPPSEDDSDSDGPNDADSDTDKDVFFHDFFFHLPSLEELKVTDCGLENDKVFNSVVSYLGTKASMTQITKINPRDFSLYVVNSISLKKLDLSGS
jgi:hypothetical protein